jgi:hypothetical protein
MWLLILEMSICALSFKKTLKNSKNALFDHFWHFWTFLPLWPFCPFFAIFIYSNPFLSLFNHFHPFPTIFDHFCSFLTSNHQNFSFLARPGGFSQAKAPKLMQSPIFSAYWAKKLGASSIPFDDLFSFPFTKRF